MLADLEAEHRRIRDAWGRLVPAERTADERDRDAAAADVDTDDEVLVGSTQLQASWEPGRVVVWAAGPGAPIADAAQLRAMLTAAGAPDSGWTAHTPVQLPDGRTAESQSIPVREVLGWLVAAGADQLDLDDDPSPSGREPQASGGGIAPSLRWLGSVATVGGRAHGARRDGAAAAPPDAPRHVALVERFVLGALDSCAGRPGAPRCRARKRCRAPCSRSTARSTAAR